MLYTDEKLTELVYELIHTGREDDWWDFKQCHYDDKATLLHDIICLANNHANRDAYLILGVQDSTFEVVGVEEDAKRKNQQKIVDFLRTPKFAGQTRPRVEVRTVFIDAHEVDVFIVKNSTDVPYYLIEDYTDKNLKSVPSQKGKTVRAFHIYTRVMDNNTPIDKSADISDVEYLWKKRFGLLQTPLEQVRVFLQKPNDWMKEDSRYYHKLFPQFTIGDECEKTDDGVDKVGNKMFYHHLQPNTSAYYGTIKIFHYNTQLFSCQSTDLDGRRMTAPCPETACIKYDDYGDPKIWFKYYTTDSIQYLLLRFFEFHIGNANGREAQIATRRFLEVVPLFDDEGEVESFKNYVYDHLVQFNELVSKQRKWHIVGETELAADVLAKEICDS